MSTTDSTHEPDPRVPGADMHLLQTCTHHDPHSVLGAHPVPGGTVLRTVRPDAISVSAVIGGVDLPLTPVSTGRRDNS